MSKLKKELARRGYWQRKFYCLAQQFTLLELENKALSTQNMCASLNTSYFFELGKMTGHNESRPLIQQLQQISSERIQRITELQTNIKNLTTKYDNIACTIQKISQDALFCVKNHAKRISIKMLKAPTPKTTAQNEVEELIKLKTDPLSPIQERQGKRKLIDSPLLNQEKQRKRKKKKREKATEVQTPQNTIGIGNF